jgi:hypothetical protein
MAKVHIVKRARKDIPGTNIKKGNLYYWWKFPYGSKQISELPPRPSQLTQSEFMSTLLSCMESIEDLDVNDWDEVQSTRESVVTELCQLRDDTDDKLNNMPESLQQGPTGELLQNRIDEVGTLVDELEAMDLDVEVGDDDDVSDREAALEELKGVSYNGE